MKPSVQAPRGPSRWRTIWPIAANEVRAVTRDGRLPIALIALVTLLTAAILSGRARVEAATQERADARTAAARQWVEQDDKNPHAAAHYGTHAFKPVGTLEAFDPGATPWLGVTLTIEAHRRELASDAPAADATALDRFLTLSPATVLQLLLPLVIIALGFAVWTRERELGTLRQLIGMGVAPSALYLGKTLGFIIVLSIVVVPAGLVTALTLGGPEAAADESSGGRVAWVLLLHLVWVLIWAALTQAVSALCRTSRASLVVLLALWGGVGLVGPRLVVDVAAALAPVPAREAFALSLARSLKDGLPGQPRETRIEELTEKRLAAEGFAEADMFMDVGLLAALELQAEAAFENEVFDYHFAALDAALERREAIARWLTWLSPYAAMRSVSSGLSGTDTAHHREFAQAAETWRQALVSALNTAFATHAGDKGWDYRAGREVWESTPPMRWSAPAVSGVLATQGPALAALFGWLLLALVVGALAVSRVRVA